MSEVPYVDSSSLPLSSTLSLGPDLASLSEEELLRCFLSDEYEDLSPPLSLPSDSKVPSPSLLPPSLPIAVEKPIQTTHPVAVKKECQQKNNGKSKTPLPPPLPTLSLPLSSSSLLSLPSSLPIRQSPSALLPTVKPHQPAPPPSSPRPPLSVSSKSSPSPSFSPPPSPSPSPIIEGEEKTAKRQRRLLKNRESAQLSRVRKKMYIEELERKISALTSENNGLRDEVVKLNDTIKQTDGDEGTRHNNNKNGAFAKKYAGVCLLVVLFSLGLFLNVNPNGRQQMSENRLIEFENNSSSFSDFGSQLVARHPSSSPSSSSTSPSSPSSSSSGVEKVEATEKEENSVQEEEKKQRISIKREWEESEESFSPSPKRTKLELPQECLDVMDTGLKEGEMCGEEDDDDSIFDVLSDEAFSEDGMLSPPSLSSSSSSPSPSVPASPSIPSFSSPSSPIPSPPANSPFGVAIVVPSFPIEGHSAFGGGGAGPLGMLRGYSVVNVHVWPIMRTSM